MKRFCRQKNKGFTLIEVIIILVVGAILAAMMFTYTNMSDTRNASSLNRAAKTFALQKVMENIFTDYNLNYKSNLTAIQTTIGNEGTTQNNYGQNGSGTNTEYTIMANHFIKFVGNVETPIVTGDPQNILKVTIKNDLGETLSILLPLITTQ